MAPLNQKPLDKEVLPEAEVFVDVGANNGFYTCLAKSQENMP
jgi:hypothetical protein